MRALGILAIALVVLTLAAAVGARTELRVNDLDVFLKDQDVAVRVVVLGAVPPGFMDSLQSGVPASLRFTVELWRHNRFWRDRLVTSRIVERQLEYNVVTKEYKVVPRDGEARVAYTTRDLGDAQRVLSEVSSVALAPRTSLDALDVFYVRVLAETALRGENSWVARMSGAAERTARRSDYRTITRSE